MLPRLAVATKAAAITGHRAEIKCPSWETPQLKHDFKNHPKYSSETLLHHVF